MKKIIILLTITIGFVQISLAQIQFNNQDEVYDYWARRGIIEAVYAYMEDYVITVGDTNAKNEIIGKDKYYKLIIKEIDSKKNLPEFSKISSILKNNYWRCAEKKLFKPLKKNFENNVPLNNNFFNCTKPGSSGLVTKIPGKNNKNTKWEETIKRIIVEYKQALVDLSQKGSTSSSGENADEAKLTGFESQVDLKNVTTKQIPWDELLLNGFLFLTGLFIGGLIIYIISKKQIYSVLSIEKTNYLTNRYDLERNYMFKYIDIVYILKKQKDSYKKKSELNIQNDESNVDKLKRKISQLEIEKNNFLEQNIELGEKLEEQNGGNISTKTFDTNVISQDYKYETPPQMTNIYFSMPEGDGSFQLSNGEPLNDGKKYFRIEFEESSNKGKIFFLPSDRDQRAINRLESYLKPVCEIENITNARTASKIELLNSGKVTLINDKWVINPDNKIRIKLY